METEASKSRSLDIAFLVDAEHLRRLQSVLREIGNSLEYQVKFSDGHALQYHDIEEVLKLPNAQARSIISLIAGVTGLAKQSAYVVLKDKTSQATSSFSDSTSTSPSIEYTINGTQRNVIFWGDKLDEWTAGARQWYSVFYHGIFPFLLFGAIVLGPIWLWNNASPHLFSPEFLKSHAWLQGTCVIGLWVAIYWLFKLFPRATFAIGHGVKRHEFFVFVRRGVLAAFALSGVASLLANWLTRH